MSATGASPIYYDFDMLEEMQVVTGGADASQQTGGVGINMVTRSGGDTFRGSGRYYLTDDKFEGDNVTDDIKRQRAGSGAPIQNIKDYGFEVGGPILKGKLWYWGSYAKQDIKAGIVGFYKRDADCQAIKAALAADPLAPYSTEEVRACLGTDGTILDNYNLKLSWAVTRSNKFSFQNTWAAKTKNARNASDTRPIETTYRQMAVTEQVRHVGLGRGTVAALEGRRPAHLQRPPAARRAAGRTWATTSSSTSTKTRSTTCSASSKRSTGIYAAVLRPVRPVHPADGTASTRRSATSCRARRAATMPSSWAPATARRRNTPRRHVGRQHRGAVQQSARASRSRADRRTCTATRSPTTS